MRTALVMTTAFIAVIHAGTICHSFSLSSDDVRVIEYRGNDVIEVEGGMVSLDEGQPNLPGFSFTWVIPQGTSVTGAEVRVLSTEHLGTGFNIDPVRMMILGEGDYTDYYSDEVYLSPAPFPGSPVAGIHSGSKTGFRLGSYTLVPFVYAPVTGELELITSAEVTLHYDADPAVNTISLTPFQAETAVSALEGWIENPEMLDSWCPVTHAGGTDLEEWIVIARDAYLPALQELADHRAQMGLDVSLISTEWIVSNYDGWDAPERIRNYLKESYEERGLVFALIVGDYNQTPMTIRESDFICYGLYLGEATDLYYSDLDGTWDGDDDHQYGEWEDGLDYYTDIYVGRFPAQMLGELEVMIDKTLAYETSPPPGDWQKSALMCGAWLWPEYGYNGDRQCDSIAVRLPSDWSYNILLEDSTGYNPTNQIDIMNQGVAFIEAVGHGNEAGVWWLEPIEGMFTTGHIGSMQNGGMLPVIQSIACHPAHLAHNDSFAEWLLKWGSGGAIAAIFNSSYGLGSCPEVGPSEWLNIYFADHLFVNGEYRVGICHAVSKDMLLPTTVLRRRYCMQELILLADPCLHFIEAPAGTGGVSAQDPTSVAITGLFPNPAPGGVCSVSFQAPPGSSPVLTLYDLSGRIVMEMAAGPVTDGSGNVAFSTENASGIDLATGCYFVTVSTEQSRDSARLVLIR